MNKKMEQPNNKPKLSLHKQTIAKLSVSDMMLLQGGAAVKHTKSWEKLVDDPCTSGTTIGGGAPTK